MDKETEDSEIREDVSNPIMLDLFSGTGSVGRVFSEMGLDVVSLDKNPTVDPTICADILDWDYKATFRPGEVEIIYCSPPKMEIPSKFCDKRKYLLEATALVHKALEIVNYLQPRHWFLEGNSLWLVKKSCFYAKY